MVSVAAPKPFPVGETTGIPYLGNFSTQYVRRINRNLSLTIDNGAPQKKTAPASEQDREGVRARREAWLALSRTSTRQG